ncbi:hypothetical protein Glove_151g73 [Diversispora epigaea]|uniref:Uncharacterized protein n=1 Tax=Diversispora epigaea TaxID=1348612 RepID=A0A397IVU6_9GLOM|nr:hypothetical protein Glove_151g73 [Diversispora epigaea]
MGDIYNNKEKKSQLYSKLAEGGNSVDSIDLEIFINEKKAFQRYLKSTEDGIVFSWSWNKKR